MRRKRRMIFSEHNRSCLLVLVTMKSKSISRRISRLLSSSFQIFLRCSQMKNRPCSNNSRRSVYLMGQRQRSRPCPSPSSAILSRSVLLLKPLPMFRLLLSTNPCSTLSPSVSIKVPAPILILLIIQDHRIMIRT